MWLSMWVALGTSIWQDAGMDRNLVIAIPREHEAELKSVGVVRLSLFGSVARGDSTPQSDVDLMAEFDAAKKFSVLGRVHLENRLADLLGAKVDLAHMPMLRDGVRERAVRQAVLVF
jgi:predicted nucleotidyltransferase